MSTSTPHSKRKGWLYGIELSSRLMRPIADLTRLQQSLLFAELSQIAYMPPEPAMRCVQTIGFDESLYLDRDGAQAYCFWNENDCVTVCRGTEPNEWNDLKADVNAVTVVAETIGRVHSGFKREVDDVWPTLERILAKCQQPLWFAGHSLGGAMATICAGRSKVSRFCPNPAALFTYGSPRVGDRAYLSYCRQIHFRWVNNNDIVTRLPPTWLGYRHSGREVYIDSEGRVCDVEGWRRMVDRLRGFLLGLRRFSIDYLADHSIERYIDHIHAAIQQQRQAMTPVVPRRRRIAAR